MEKGEERKENFLLFSSFPSFFNFAIRWSWFAGPFSFINITLPPNLFLLLLALPFSFAPTLALRFFLYDGREKILRKELEKEITTMTGFEE